MEKNVERGDSGIIEDMLKEEEDIQYYAYLTLDDADPSLAPVIIEARNRIIFRQSWVADGLKGYVHDRNGNVIEEVPQFSEPIPGRLGCSSFTSRSRSVVLRKINKKEIVMRRVISAALAMVMVMAISIPAFAIDKEREVSRLAYMNLDQASEAMQEKILQAREEIIFSKSWVADGLQGFVYDKDGNVIEEVPQFSEIFPADWDMPTFDVQEDIEVENNGYLQDENSVTPLINSDDVMVTVFSDTLKLRVPSNSDTPAFDTFDTTYWYNYYHYNMTYVYTRGYDRDSSSWYKNYYNVGYSNAKTGASLGWKTNIESWDTFGITPPANTKVAVRASMYSDNPEVESGNWDIDVFAFCEILNS